MTPLLYMSGMKGRQVMNLEMVNNTRVAAYFIWEYTKDENALNLWCCAEDIASYLERFGMLATNDVINIIKKGRQDFEYIHFLRHIAFRIFIYTKRIDQLSNWFDAERLVNNLEWLEAIIYLANVYASNKNSPNNIGIKCCTIRNYYLNN